METNKPVKIQMNLFVYKETGDEFKREIKAKDLKPAQLFKQMWDSYRENQKTE